MNSASCPTLQVSVSKCKWSKRRKWWTTIPSNSLSSSQSSSFPVCNCNHNLKISTAIGKENSREPAYP